MRGAQGSGARLSGEPCRSKGEVRRIHQRVEKVGIELVATTIRARNAPKSARLVPNVERKPVPR
jgi:hypothetical protein